MDNYSALLDAIEKGKLNVLRARINEVDDINRTLDSGDKLIHVAVLFGNLEAVQLLIEKGADINVKDRYSGQTCLHYCGENGNLEIAQLLITKGADLSITDVYLNEPLWTAVFNVGKNSKRRLDLVSLFLENGGDKNHKNKAGVSPLELAKDFKHKKLIDILEQNG